MSFSFSVPDGLNADFATTAAAAKTALETSSENNDYVLSPAASDACDIAIAAASQLAATLGDDDATVTASIGGHRAVDGVSASTLTITVTVTPAALPES